MALADSARRAFGLETSTRRRHRGDRTPVRRATSAMARSYSTFACLAVQTARQARRSAYDLRIFPDIALANAA
jgi:hypothetical protein